MYGCNMKNIIEKPQEINDFITIAAVSVIVHVVIFAVGAASVRWLHAT